MAQHGRLVISCAGTLHVTDTANHIRSLCQDPGGGRCANVAVVNMRTGQANCGERCVFLDDYSHVDRLGKVVTFIYTCILHRVNLHVYFGSTELLFGILDKNLLYGSLELVFWHNADSAEVLN